MSGQARARRRLGILATIRLLWAWLVLLSKRDDEADALRPMPGAVAFYVRERGWGAQRVAAFYERWLEDEQTTAQAYIDRAREVEEQIKAARQESLLEGRLKGEAAARAWAEEELRDEWRRGFRAGHGGNVDDDALDALRMQIQIGQERADLANGYEPRKH